MKSDRKGHGSIEPCPSAIFQRRTAKLPGKYRREFTLIFVAHLCREDVYKRQAQAKSMIMLDWLKACIAQYKVEIAPILNQER